MSVVAMEFYCMKTVMIHLINKSDFILSDQKTGCKSLQQIQLSLQSLRTVIFSCTKLALWKVSVSRKCKSSQETRALWASNLGV